MRPAQPLGDLGGEPVSLWLPRFLHLGGEGNCASCPGTSSPERIGCAPRPL